MAYDNEQYVVLYTTNRSFQRSFSKKCVCVCVYDTPDDGGRKVTAIANMDLCSRWAKKANF